MAHRSLPQMRARVTRTTASVASLTEGSGDLLDADVERGVDDGRQHVIILSCQGVGGHAESG